MERWGQGRVARQLVATLATLGPVPYEMGRDMPSKAQQQGHDPWGYLPTRFWIS